MIEVIDHWPCLSALLSKSISTMGNSELFLTASSFFLLSTEVGNIMSLKGTQTEQNLKDAFAGESQANRRYLYFAQRADVEGYNDVSTVFRSTAEGETGHAHGHLEYLEETGDPATGLPIGPTGDNLRAAIAGETHEYTDMYPGMARTAREEGLDEIADWFETLAKAERSHANRFQKALDELD
jgi:rubrerythrin